MSQAFIVSATRTPIGRFLGGLKSKRAPELGAIVVREAVKRAKIDPETIEEVFRGNVLQAGLGQNPARQATIFADLPNKIGCVTINKVCGSGLKSVILAAQAIKAGDLDVAVAGGMESMTNAPYLMPEAREGTRLGNAPLVDSHGHRLLRPPARARGRQGLRTPRQG